MKNISIKRLLSGFVSIILSVCLLMSTASAFAETRATNQVTEDTKEVYKAELTSAIDTIAKDLNLTSSKVSKYQKILRIYNFLCTSVKYDNYSCNYNTKIRNNNYNGKILWYGQSAYGALLSGRSVCQGYADAFELLANKAGLKSIEVASDIHAWNLVELGGKYYNVDATWDSSNYSKGKYNYFLVKNSSMNDSAHKRISKFNSTAFNKKYPMSTKDYFSGRTYSLSGKCSHKNKVALYSRKNTCVNNAYYGGKVCKDCGCVLGMKLSSSKSGHRKYLYITEKSTCKSKGYKQYNCLYCSYTIKTTLEKVAHKYVNTIVNPTCTEKGYTIHRCSVCYYEYKDNYTNVLGHNYNKTEEKRATCLEKGYTKKQCTRCAKLIYTNETAALGHSYTETVVQPTCTSKGYTIHRCVRCADTYNTNETAALRHSYTETVVDPTCTSKGYIIRQCVRCGNTYNTNETVALGHSYTKKIVDPTCTSKGYTINKCTKCGLTYKSDETAALGHIYTEKVKQPTCKIGGYTVHKCTVCGYAYSSDETAALGHRYIATVHPAYCTTYGYTEYICSGCRNLYRDNIVEALGHNYVEIVEEPTCTTKGRKYNKCTRCSAINSTQYINALGHEFSNYKSNNDATCYYDGTKTSKCDRCDVTNTVIDYGSQLNHKVVVEKGVAPTCTKSGTSDKKYCALCKEVLEDSKILARKDHTFKCTVIKPTYELNGCYYYECKDCGYYKYEGYIPRLEVPTVTFKKVSSTKNKIKLKWTKKSCSGYQIQIATNSKFTKGKKTYTISKNKTVSKTIKKLKSKKKYYIRIRAYKKVGKTKYYSDWKVKTIKTK